MISEILFAEEFRKVITLCSFPQAMLNPKQIETYYNEFKKVDENILLTAFKNICKSPPNKLTAEQIWIKIYDIKPKLKTDSSDWTGKECDIEECNRGLISERIGKYDVLFKCTRCGSSKMKHISDHTPENVWNEKQKHKPVDRKPGRMETLTKGIG